MLQEIAEQPAALLKTVREERAKIGRLAEQLKWRGVNLIVIVARGSSDNAAQFGRYLLEIRSGIPVSLSAPSVYTLYDAHVKCDRALYIGVSQSGEGEDINFVLERARACGAFTIGITNEAQSSMAGIVDEVLLMHGGRERSVAATKTYTGQMMLFYMLAEALSDREPELDYEKIPEYAARALEPLAGIAEMERHRGTAMLRDLARGPGRLAQALAIDRALDGLDLGRQGALWLGEDGFSPGAIGVSTMASRRRWISLRRRLCASQKPALTRAGPAFARAKRAASLASGRI